MRHSGIQIIGDVPWGTHFCQFYRDQQDLLDLLVPYFKAGLKNNEFCMWVTSAPLPTEAAKCALSEEVPDLERYIASGQIEILDCCDWYTIGGKFDPDRVLSGWVERLEAARQRGFDGLRLTGNTFWLEKSEWRDFTEYEATVDSVIGQYPMLAICTYSLEKCGAAEIMDVVSNHAFALIKRGGEWHVIESAERKRTEEALRQQREWLRVTLSSIGDAVLATDIAGNTAFLNPIAATLTGWSEGEALGRPVQDVFRIKNENTREDGGEIVARVLREGKMVRLANNTLLRARDGREIPIEDSAAPIRDAAGNVAGVVLVFRDVTEQHRAQEALRESEERVKLKLESILSPEGEISGLELGDIIDTRAIQALMDDFYVLSKMPMAIIDLKGSVLIGVGWQDICTKFHRVHPESCKNCVESDTELSAGVLPGERKLYKCKNGMWDVATPITIGGRHVGNLFSGQFFFDNERLDYELFRSQARRYGFDEQAYLSALEKVPRLTSDRVTTGMAFLAKLGDMLSLLSYSNIKLARSLSEREGLMHSLNASADRLRRSQEIAHLGSWELDLVNDRLEWSDEVYRIFGLQPQEFGVTYETFLNAVHHEDRAAVDAAFSGSLRDGKDSYQITHRVVRRGTGEVRWVEERCDHIRDESGRIIRSIGMVQDITERVLAEQALHESQKLESIGVLAGGIAHDFNNILTSVLGNASLLTPQLGRSPELAAIIESSERAASLTRQLLAYAGKGQFQITDFDVAHLVTSSADIIRVSIPRTISLTADVPEHLPPVRGDASQIYQVVMNLIINAAEAIGEGGDGAVAVRVRVRDLDTDTGRRISPELAPGRYIAVSVRDNGRGMDAVTKSKIFDPFFTTKFTGRGLGLAAVQGILRSHKGGITVETSPVRGSTFTVYLPCRTGQYAEAGRNGTTARTQSATILVVDDEEQVRTVAKTALERFGHRVLVANDGGQALDALEADGEVDLVLLDVIMPGGSGAQTFSEISKWWPNVAVLVTSGYSREEAQRLGIPGELPFIEKPYTVQTLIAAVNSTLEGRVRMS